MQSATDLVVLFAPPPQQRRSHQLPDRVQAPRFIPNGPWSPRSHTESDPKPTQPNEAVLSPRDRSAAWRRNAAIGLCALAG